MAQVLGLPVMRVVVAVVLEAVPEWHTEGQEELLVVEQQVVWVVHLVPVEALGC